MLEELAWERLCPGFAAGPCVRVVNLLIESELWALAEETIEEEAGATRRREFSAVASMSQQRVIDLFMLDRLIATIKNANASLLRSPDEPPHRMLDLAFLDELLARVCSD